MHTDTSICFLILFIILFNYIFGLMPQLVTAKKNKNLKLVLTVVQVRGQCIECMDNCNKGGGGHGEQYFNMETPPH